ncbi:MAG: response regulator [Myxococcales bacterium]|nr:response regulator [Myxococcales bacterium]
MSAPIVLVDDEPLLCRALTLTLRRLGRVVLTFTDPREAVAHLATSERPAVVICDYRMPALTGLDVLARLPAGIPFILISGDLAIGESAQLDRVTAFLSKPFKPEELLAAVEPLLR